ncbi:hypothetical protein MMC16_005438 [Acarospora aff. strigata]|nr:hypothetical protein [Acarospora aff. strigata]
MAPRYYGIVNETDLDMYEGACDRSRQEWMTAKFWMQVLIEQFPKSQGFRLACEQPPVPGDPQRADADICAICDRRERNLLFVEWKKGAMDTASGRDAAEEQVNGYCMAYLKANPSIVNMYAMVCAGGRARIWEVKQREDPEATEGNDPDLYSDAKTDPDNCLAKGFEAVRRLKANAQ